MSILHKLLSRTYDDLGIDTDSLPLLVDTTPDGDAVVQIGEQFSSSRVLSDDRINHNHPEILALDLRKLVERYANALIERGSEILVQIERAHPTPRFRPTTSEDVHALLGTFPVVPRTAVEAMFTQLATQVAYSAGPNVPLEHRRSVLEGLADSLALLSLADSDASSYPASRGGANVGDNDRQ